MKTIRVSFLDWYDWILPESTNDNIFLWILKKHYNVIIDNQNPDVLFYSLYFNNHLKYKNCLKIYVNSEPLSYNNLSMYDPSLRHIVSINDANYMFSSYKSNIEKNYYMPIFLLWLYHHIFVTKKIESFESLLKRREVKKRNNFCIFLHNNNVPQKRKIIYDKLNNYKFVHTKSDVNIPEGSLNKINYLEDFKFSFAMQNHFYTENFENWDVPGLIDEKIIESLISGSIPLYYGNDLIGDYLNENAFINYHNFKNDEDFINKIIEIDNDDNLYEKISSEPIIKNINNLRLNELESHLLKIVNENI